MASGVAVGVRPTTDPAVESGCRTSVRGRRRADVQARNAGVGHIRPGAGIGIRDGRRARAARCARVGPSRTSTGIQGRRGERAAHCARVGGAGARVEARSRAATVGVVAATRIALLGRGRRRAHTAGGEQDEKRGYTGGTHRGIVDTAPAAAQRPAAPDPSAR